MVAKQIAFEQEARDALRRGVRHPQAQRPPVVHGGPFQVAAGQASSREPDVSAGSSGPDQRIEGVPGHRVPERPEATLRFGYGFESESATLERPRRTSPPATTVRELAAYHEKAAAGTPATPPRGGSRFESGAGAPEPTERELSALAAKASTPTEHRALEEYFLTLAKRYTAEADAHATFAQTYRGTRIAQAAVHHDRLATLSRDAAKEANEAAAMHKQLAGIAR